MTNWFPGHMHKGVLQIQHALRDVDCVVEVHDARIPFSGRNPRFRDIISMRPHVLVLNKTDLAEIVRNRSELLNKLQSQGVENVLFTNCTKGQQKSISEELIPMVSRAIESRPRHHRQNVESYNLMVIGVPNVGKSAFINAVRRSHTTLKKNAVRVGALAGVTRAVHNKIRVGFDPDMFLIDTPGILPPAVPDMETGMRLALCACLPDRIIGEEYIVDYLLYWFNKHQELSYVLKFEMEEPVDNVYEFLTHVSIKYNMTIKKKSAETGKYELRPDFSRAADFVLKLFRSGDFGKLMIDKDKFY